MHRICQGSHSSTTQEMVQLTHKKTGKHQRRDIPLAYRGVAQTPTPHSTHPPHRSHPGMWQIRESFADQGTLDASGVARAGRHFLAAAAAQHRATSPTMAAGEVGGQWWFEWCSRKGSVVRHNGQLVEGG